MSSVPAAPSAQLRRIYRAVEATSPEDRARVRDIVDGLHDADGVVSRNEAREARALLDGMRRSSTAQRLEALAQWSTGRPSTPANPSEVRQRAAEIGRALQANPGASIAALGALHDLLGSDFEKVAHVPGGPAAFTTLSTCECDVDAATELVGSVGRLARKGSVSLESAAEAYAQLRESVVRDDGHSPTDLGDERRDALAGLAKVLSLHRRTDLPVEELARAYAIVRKEEGEHLSASPRDRRRAVADSAQAMDSLVALHRRVPELSLERLAYAYSDLVHVEDGGSHAARSALAQLAREVDKGGAHDDFEARVADHVATRIEGREAVERARRHAGRRTPADGRINARRPWRR